MTTPDFLRRARPVGLSLAMLAILCFAVDASAAPLAGTRIGNQASATYRDTGGVDRSTLSNLVETEVTQVAGLVITPASTLALPTVKNAAAGSQVEFPLTVQNTGNGDDTFNLSSVDLGTDFSMTSVLFYADGGGGVPTGPPITSTPLISAGGNFQFVLVAITPATALDAQTNKIEVTAASALTPATTAQAWEQTVITDDAVVTVTKSITPGTSGNPGASGFTVRMQYQNTGNGPASDVTLTDVLPTGMDYVLTSGRWSVTGATVLTDADGGALDFHGTAPNTIVYEYDVPTTTVTAVVNQVLPGQTGEVTFEFDVDGAAAAGVLNNTIAFSYDTGSPIATVGPFASNSVLFNVNQLYTVTVGDDSQGPVTQGATVDFTHVITNTGNGTDSFSLSYANVSFPAGTAFSILETDTSPFTNPTPAIAAGATYSVLLRAVLPPTATGGPYTADITATSLGSGSTVTGTGTATLTLITSSGVDLTNNVPLACVGCGEGAGPEGAPVDTESGDPGTTVTHVLFANNISGPADSYDLAASTDSSFATLVLPPGWSVQFQNTVGTPITNTGAIAPGGSVEVRAVVTIPANAPAVPAPGVSLYFRTLSPVSLASDVKHDAVVVNTLRSVVLAPNNSGTGYQAGFVDYTHTLTNAGNVTENSGGATVTLALGNVPATFSSAVYIDVNTNGVYDAGTDTPISGPADIPAMLPGDVVDLVVRVTIPGGAPLGSIGTTTLTATMAGVIDGVAAPAISSVDDVTTVSENVALVKEQALDPTCSGTPGVYTQALQLAAPGECVHYRVTATNNALGDVTNVVISDSTPTDTTYEATTAAAVTLGSITTVPIDEASGTVVATVGTLTPTSSAVMTFMVQIDP